tara:strand:+ start:72 stop:362 length:291 start_codon:yes stop_codon:yes gene_type:complete
MSNKFEMSITEFHQLAHMISSIVHDLDIEVSGVRYDGGVIGFGGHGESPAEVVINRDLDCIAYNDTYIEGKDLRCLYGVGLLHDIDVIPMVDLNGR